MNKLNELKNRKLDNKGFSLVELIIVIAIMAVLIGVLAPQYLKYVEKSKKAADEESLQRIISAVQVYYSDPNNTLPAPGTYNVTSVAATGAVQADNVIRDACKDAGVEPNNITIKSSAYKGKTLQFKVETGGSSKFTANDANLAKALAIGTHP